MKRALPPRHTEAGVTLIEMMVALALFALIAGAGFSVLDQVLRTQRQTEGRLEQLAGMQRAMYLFNGDLGFAQSQSLAYSDDAGMTLRRQDARGSVALEYTVLDGVLTRVLDDGRVTQPLLSGVQAAEWRFLDETSQWQTIWPVPRPGVLASQTATFNPRAVELVLTVDQPGGLRGLLRRVAVLPGEAQ